MEHLNGLSQARPDPPPTCLTIGAFDGVHRGHQRVIKQLLETTRENGCRPAALTFFPLPKQVLGRPNTRFYLTTPELRANLLHQMGIELVVTHPFDEVVRQIRAADFVDMLVKYLNIKEIWVGADFALGYQREGDVAFLRAQGVEKGFSIRTVDFFTVDSQVVSSSLIRQLVRGGQIELANHLLGRPFRLPGQVIPGTQRGRQMGFPTANLSVWQQHILPARGVYAARVQLDDQTVHPAAVNIGFRPTVSAGEQLSVEAHLVDFSGDLYGQPLALDLLTRIRDEIQFDNLANLIAQLSRDVAETRRLFELLA